MSWGKKLRTPGDILKPGDSVESVVLGVNVAERRISLGLKQALGDPWSDVRQRFPVGSAVEGPVTSLMKFGAFVQLAEGVEGMVHVSDISAEKRLNHPQDMLKVGQVVKAQVLEIDTERRRLKLGMKQLVPTSLEEYIAEHKEGDRITGRIVNVSDGQAQVELGEGILASCKLQEQTTAQEGSQGQPKADLSSLTSMLQARWKGGSSNTPSRPEPAHAGQIRSFRIAKLDPAAKKIEVELV
jgi:small subunit ribosomal protein S1